jgi:abequosyltransferase
MGFSIMKFPILSICIPTYNRSVCLGECLESVLSSAKGYEEQIEVLISDDASTDDTVTVINEFKKRSCMIRYHRNGTNLGMMRNIYAVAGLASGEYIWILGDDDKITGEAVSSVLSRIESGYNLIICNVSLWSKDFSVMKKQRFLPIKRDEVFDDPNELMKRFGLHLGFISCIIVKKSLFLNLPPAEYEPFIEYGFTQLYSLYAGMVPNCHATCIFAPLVCNRMGNSDIDWCKIFIVGSSLIFEALLTKGFTQSAVRSAKYHVLRYYVIGGIIVRKARAGAELKGVGRSLFSYYKKSWLFWLVCMPVLYTPVPAFLIRIALRYTWYGRQ